jgi:uncharacterized membrane protein YphA (DoxX/SURF4 family)
VSKQQRFLLIVEWALRLIIGGVFLYASFSKIAHPDEFARAIYYYHLLPESLLHLFALYLPWLELVAGLAIVFGPWKSGAEILIILMCMLFIAALLSAVLRDLDISCGCFGKGSHKVGLGLLIQDSFLLLGTAYLRLRTSSVKSLDHSSSV